MPRLYFQIFLGGELLMYEDIDAIRSFLGWQIIGEEHEQIIRLKFLNFVFVVQCMRDIKIFLMIVIRSF